MPWTVAPVSRPPQHSPTVTRNSSEAEPSPEMFATWTTRTRRNWDVKSTYEAESYAVFCKKGRRRSKMVVLWDPKQAFFGVFDGHGGAKAADFTSHNLQKNVTYEMSKTSNNMKEALKKGYLTTDDQFLKQDVHGGTCGVTAVIHRGDLVVSNAGDCRAVMSRGTHSRWQGFFTRRER